MLVVPLVAIGWHDAMLH